MGSIPPLLITLCLLQAAVVWSDCDKPNIIMFVIDDLGWNDTGYQGADYSTPTIDSMAAEAIRLDQYYTQSICSPSRAALLSGKYPYHLSLAHTVVSNGYPFGLSLAETTIAQQLNDGGYSSHAVGKLAFIKYKLVALTLNTCPVIKCIIMRMGIT